MNTHALKYYTIFTAPILGYCSLTYTGWWVWVLPAYVFVLIPLLELFLKVDTHNMSKAEEEMRKEDPIYDMLLYSLIPIQYILLFYFCYTINQPNLTGWDIAGRVLTMGISCAALGINVAHELGHRKRKYEQTMSKTLLLTSLYMHFFIEHNRGHHKNVATTDDPATARYGEVVYLFWLRSCIGSYLSAWKLEKERLANIGQPFWSLQNEMIRYQFIQIAFVVLIYSIFDWKSTLAFIGAATIGFLLLETINYVEHYGLMRKKNEAGIYENVLPVHSWNSDHVVGRIMLFELTRHSDHHYRASRKYQVLRHFEEAPQMPTGYPGMVVLSLIPPLWFWVMHRRIAYYRQKYTTKLA